METLPEQLHTVMSYARNNTHSDFYRTLYAKRDVPEQIDSFSTWRIVPTLTKSDIFAVPFWERIFIPPEAVDTLRNTSGTTGGDVLVVPRNKYTGSGYFPASVTVRGVLNFLAAHHIQERQVKMISNNAVVVAGHPLYMEQSVRLAAHARVNVILVFSFMIDALYPLLNKYHLADQIELIEFMGERVTESIWQKTKAHLPRATVIADYGSSELQSIAAVAYPENHPHHACEYVPQATHLIELLEKDNDAVITESGIEGELTITTLWTENNPFPLVRYRTGDAATLIKTDEDPSRCTYDILGRINLDRIKINGGELRVEEVERVLARHSEVGSEFELHFYGDTTGEALPRVELRIEPNNVALDTALLGESIAKELRVSPTFTYQEGVGRGLYAPLTLSTLTSDKKTKKTVRFFRH